MPTNLPPQCVELEKKYLEAKTVSDKIITLQEYLGAIPKHKGTERLRRQLKIKLSKLRGSEIKRREKISSSVSGKFAIKKEGAAQIIILGITTSGKSSLLSILTKANPKILGQPFTTIEPIPGMMNFEDIQIQLVEAPAIFEGASRGIGWGNKVLSLVRNSDGLLLLLDLSLDNPCSQLEMMIKELSNIHVTIMEKKGRVEIERKENGGIQVICFGKFDGSIEKVKELLKEKGMIHAVVKIYGETNFDDIALEATHQTLYKPTIIVANKCDIDGAEEKLNSVKKKFNALKVIGTSTITKEGIDDLPRILFESLKILRIYTKKPKIGQEIIDKPIISKFGSTVGDIAKVVHKIFYEKFKYAKVWGSTKYPGERVGLSHVLIDKDIVEFHI